jgi:hypothetical protein
LFECLEGREVQLGEKVAGEDQAAITVDHKRFQDHNVSFHRFRLMALEVVRT